MVYNPKHRIKENKDETANSHFTSEYDVHVHDVLLPSYVGFRHGNLECGSGQLACALFAVIRIAKVK